MYETELNRYLHVEETFFNSLNRKLAGNLSLYCITGSLARKEIIPEWTDIDILLAIDELKLEAFESISETITENESDIKIGLSVFSTQEISSNRQKLARTMLAINEIIEGTLTPRIRKEHILLVQTTEEVILKMSRIEYARALHDYKRSILDCNPVNEAKTYKLLILMMKILLMEKGIIAKSYDEVLEHLAILNLPFTIQNPQAIIQTPNLFSRRKAQYADLVNNLTNFLGNSREISISEI